MHWRKGVGGRRTDMAYDLEDDEYWQTCNHDPVVNVIPGRVSPPAEQPQQDRRDPQQLDGQWRHQLCLLRPQRSVTCLSLDLADCEYIRHAAVLLQTKLGRVFERLVCTYALGITERFTR